MSNTLSVLQGLAPFQFSTTSLPNALAGAVGEAGYSAGGSAFSLGAWNYNGALSPQLLSTALAQGEAFNQQNVSTLADLGGAEFADISSEFSNWGNAQESFMSQIAQSFNTIVNKSSKPNGGGLLGVLGF